MAPRGLRAAWFGTGAAKLPWFISIFSRFRDDFFREKRKKRRFAPFRITKPTNILFGVIRPLLSLLMSHKILRWLVQIIKSSHSKAPSRNEGASAFVGELLSLSLSLSFSLVFFCFSSNLKLSEASGTGNRANEGKLNGDDERREPRLSHKCATRELLLLLIRTPKKLSLVFIARELQFSITKINISMQIRSTLSWSCHLYKAPFKFPTSHVD
jgi:hypothetical protein